MQYSHRIMLFSLGTVFVLFSACAPVYIPSARHTHFMGKKGELHASSVLTSTNGGDIQAAYAVSEHIGINAATSFGNNDEQSSDYHKHRYGEIGMTYFRPIGDIGRFEALGGVGFGSAESIDHYECFRSAGSAGHWRITASFYAGQYRIKDRSIRNGSGLAAHVGKLT